MRFFERADLPGSAVVVDAVTDFLIELGMKPPTYLQEIIVTDFLIQLGMKPPTYLQEAFFH